MAADYHQSTLSAQIGFYATKSVSTVATRHLPHGLQKGLVRYHATEQPKKS
jgi:hypothetical protein